MEKLKIFMLGMLVALLMMMVMGAGSSGQVGRYQIAGAGDSTAFVLDTKTGRVCKVRHNVTQSRNVGPDGAPWATAWGKLK